MNCTGCVNKNCRTKTDCAVELVPSTSVLAAYQEPGTHTIVRAAANLVDGGRAGTLSRLEELAELIKGAGYARAGLAYCYGMEKEATAVAAFLRERGISLSTVSCTVGGLPQNAVNSESNLCGVSCNPIGQAENLKADGVDIAIQFGLCLGHDILFHRHFPGDTTVLAVKDRTAPQRSLL